MKAGQGPIEVSNQWRAGHAGEAAEIPVVCAGATGIPLTVPGEGDPA